MVEENVFETGNFNFYINYIGPLGGAGAKKSIKVDISRTEILINSPDYKIHRCEYSDLQEDQKILSYELDELIPEKLRALMQRTEPRDLYDIWYMFEVEGFEIEDYICTFQEKARHKGYDPDKLVQTVTGKENTFQRIWDLHLSSQMNNLPDFSDVWRDLKKHWKRYSKLIDM